MKNRTLPFLAVLILAVVTWFARRHSPSGVPAPVPDQPAANQPAPDFPAARREPRTGPRSRSGDDAARTGAQAFDFYLLNLSWSPEFCATHPDKPECAAHPGFVLHGLWPQNINGSYPQHCTDAPGPQDAAGYRDLYPDTGLLEHEWSTHGTCSGLAPDAYFQDARRAFQSVRIPREISSLTQQTSMPPADILALFARNNPGFPADSLVLSCGNNYLTAVEVCLDKSLHPISCPAMRSCRASTVRIPPPGGN